MAEKPRSPIRRFDVFAEYNRVKNMSAGMPEDEAKGGGIWIAKIVAGRRGMPAHHDRDPDEKSDGDKADGKGKKEPNGDKFKSVGGEPQTDATFDKEIIERMGREFYEETFRPAIEDAFADGQSYEDIRDSIRKGWK